MNKKNTIVQVKEMIIISSEFKSNNYYYCKVRKEITILRSNRKKYLLAIKIQRAFLSHQYLFLLTVIIHIFSEDDEPVTPFRELIKQYPEKAIKILNYCNR